MLVPLISPRRGARALLPLLEPYRFLSRLREHFGFVAPESLAPRNPNPNSKNDLNTKKKKTKPPYRPPSSLESTGKKPVHSDLPFDFRFSYTESSQDVKPIGLREPKYSPFGPGRIDRSWDGICAPAVDRTLRSVDDDEPTARTSQLDQDKSKATREKILGKPLSPMERASIIQQCQKNRTKRQVNLGRDGLTHNMLNDIHNNWKHAEAVRIKCLGVPTVDMKNICLQLEDKTGGLVIHRHGGHIVLYRGRQYNPKRRPVIPLMLWKPHEPVYPRLIKKVIDGFSIEETKQLRKAGLAVPALTKLAKNGYYASLVPMVRDAFLSDELVRIDCKGLPRSDYKKIGVKLRDLVPCVIASFDKEQIVLWRGKNYDPSANRGEHGTSFPLPIRLSASDKDDNGSDISNRATSDETSDDEHSSGVDESFSASDPTFA